MSDELSLRVSNLLALAIHAQGQGNHELADQLTERALKLLEGAYGTDAPEPPAVAPPSTSTIPQQQQQQQQRQADPKDEGEPE
jgi:hypothetical protein